MTGCLKYLIEKFKKSFKVNEPEVKYIPLQSIICEPLEYDVKRCMFVSHKVARISINRSEKIKLLTLTKDCILFGEDESIKYDYILNIEIINSMCFKLNILGDINIHDVKMYPADNLASILIQLECKKTRHFIKHLMIYITSYKKYNSFDKSVFKFETFKNYFKK